MNRWDYLHYWKEFKKKNKIKAKTPPKSIQILGTATVEDLFKYIFFQTLYFHADLHVVYQKKNGMSICGQYL